MTTTSACLPHPGPAGAAAAASTLSWLAFLPIAFIFGLTSRSHGPATAGWLILAIAVAVAALLTRAVRRTSPDRQDSACPSTCGA